MTLFIVCFIAGALTVLAPCILPVLPVVLGGSLIGDEQDTKSLRRPLVVIGSLAVSVTVFTLLLKTSTSLLSVPVWVWSLISGVIVILLGITMVFPALWEAIMLRLGLSSGSNRLLAQARGRDVLTGFALGPVFNSCSPTYALIVAVLLPASFIQGVAYLGAYVLGLSLMLLLIAILGGSIVNKLAAANRPGGPLAKTLGIIMVLVGIGILVGADKQLQTFIIDNGWYAPISDLEKSLR
jgi:cytochrome c biogenesis protein CcdA